MDIFSNKKYDLHTKHRLILKPLLNEIKPNRLLLGFFIYVNFKNGQSIFLMIEMSTEIVSENGKIDQKGIQDNFVECIEIVLCLCLYLSKLTELYT